MAAKVKLRKISQNKTNNKRENRPALGRILAPFVCCMLCLTNSHLINQSIDQSIAHSIVAYLMKVLNDVKYTRRRTYQECRLNFVVCLFIRKGRWNEWVFVRCCYCYFGFGLNLSQKQTATVDVCVLSCTIEWLSFVGTGLANFVLVVFVLRIQTTRSNGRFWLFYVVLFEPKMSRKLKINLKKLEWWKFH